MRVLSKKNKYYIPKERYLELKHFCLQYEDWQEAYRELEDVGLKSRYILTPSKNKFTEEYSDVERIAFSRYYYAQKIDLVQNAAMLADRELYQWILRGVTEARDYNNLRLVLNMPCGKNTYYDRYRKFFYILDKTQTRNL